MAGKKSTPEIRTEAFIAAREKCAMSVEELAHLACLSKKQIQQIENGQSSSFYSPTVKFTAAKKVAKLIQLEEKDAFDFGPQAELPFVQPAEVTQTELTVAQKDSIVDTEQEAPKKEAVKKEAAQANQGELKGAKKKAVSRKTKAEEKSLAPSHADAKPSLVEAPMPELSKRIHSGTREHKSAGKKWMWFLSVGLLVFALVQFQPLLRDQLDAMMGKAKPVEAIALPSAPPADAAPSNPPTTEANAAPLPAAPTSATSATTPVPPVAPSSPAPVASASGCSPADVSMETYKPSSAGKPGNLVFVKANAAQLVCVIDAGGVVQSKTLEPGLGHSFYGKPPFKVFTPGFASVEVYFQGFRVRPSTPDAKNILLVQTD